MSDDFIAAALARHARAQARRQPWEALWQDIAQHMLPSHTPIGDAAAGGERTGKIFDGTATRMLRRQAATLMGLMTSPAERWFTLTARDAGGGPLADEAVGAWLEGTAERLYAALAESNFYSAIGEAYVDLIAFGTTCPFVDERPVRGPGFNGFLFRTLAPGEYWIEEDEQGDIDTVIRLLPLDARRAVLKFGRAALDAAITETLAREGQDSGRDWPFLHLVFRRTDPELGREAVTGDRSYRAFDWQSVYLDQEHERLIERGGFRERRYFPVRWSVASGEIYGRGPGMEALPDVKTLNLLARYGLEAAVLDVYPPFLGPDEALFGRLRLMPGAYNVYDPEIGGEIRPLRSGGNFAIEARREADLRQAIAAAFLDDVFGLRESGQITATEILDRRERRQQVTAPAIARLQTELLDPLVETCWRLMLRAGAFAPPPAALAAAERIHVDYLSPLSRAQRMGRARALQDTFALIRPLAEARPEMLDHYDFDALARDLPHDIGVPQTWLKDRAAVARLRAERAARRQAATALSEGQALAETAAAVAGTTQ